MSSRNTPQASLSVGYPNTNSAQRLGALRSWRWRGSLQDLPHLAIEIQLKVYSYLCPRDLLVLARTCKQFRAFFLHRSNEPLWHAARENVENLPRCPPFMSEPAFMNLLFSTHCQNCGKSSVWEAMWIWFVRYCPKCVLALSYSYNEARDKILNVDQHESFCTSGALLGLFGVYRNHAVRWLSDRSSFAFRFHKDHIETFIQELDQLPKPITNEARSQVIERQKANIADRQPCVNACIYWQVKRQTERDSRLEDKRLEHVTEIIKHLKEVGWDKELAQSQYWIVSNLQTANIQAVRQPSKLTPKSWERVFKAIYPILRPYRHQRLVKESAGVLRPRFAALQAAILAHYIQLPRTARMDCHPDSVDLALMDECRAIADVPADQTVTQEDFARLVPELAARWEQERKKELTEAVIAHLRAPPPDDVDVLGLGIALFACMHCKLARDSDSRLPALYRYPAILGHTCAHAALEIVYDFEKRHNKDMEVYPTLAAMPSTEQAGRYRWWYPFTFSRRGLETTMYHLSYIMVAMGLDPSRTTQGELDACPARLGCRRCEKTRIERNEVPRFSKTYSWEAALDHAFDHHDNQIMIYRYNPSLWELADTSVGGDPEGALSFMTPGSVWACSLCVQWDDRGDRIKAWDRVLGRLHQGWNDIPSSKQEHPSFHDAPLREDRWQ
ncbi:hypothetical protein C8Q74DRAFT_345030 [Fomes fomentarius]|nr:hypothetical protein C8Q74DRAFT_345030 [Fomes fomentarius]